MQLLLVMCAVKLRDNDARTRRQTTEQAEQRIDDRPRAAYRGKRLLAYIVADDDGVHRIVQLLKDVAYHQRQGKINEQPGYAAFSHIRVPAFQNRSHALPSNNS